MKTLLSLSSLISATITGIVSFKLFEEAHYDFSALLTIASFLAAILLVSILASKKINAH